MRRAIVLIAVAAVVVGVIAAAGGFDRSSSPAATPAPALPASVLVPPRVGVATLRGKPAVVNFWASWCEPCRREAAALERFARRIRGRARIVGVNWNDAAHGARAFVRRYGWTFPNLRDGDGTAGDKYGIKGLPTTFILDRRGRIVRTLTGPQSVASIAAALRGVTG